MGKAVSNFNTGNASKCCSTICTCLLTPYMYAIENTANQNTGKPFEQGWYSSESAYLPAMWPRCDYSRAYTVYGSSLLLVLTYM